MAINARFSKLVAVLSSDKINEAAKEAGVLAVKAIYSNQDAEMVLILLNDTPQHVRKAFASWFGHQGVIVNKPRVGETAFTVGNTEGVLTSGKQAKVFEKFAKGEVPDVVAMEQRATTEKKPPKYHGAERARREVTNLIARLKKQGDTDAAAFLNDVWTRNFDATIEAEILNMQATTLKKAA